MQVKVSSRYQITIPQKVRELLGIQRGQMVTVSSVGGVMEVIPDRELSEMEGIFPELSLCNIRDESDRIDGISKNA